MAAVRSAATLDQARVARQLPRPEADLVSPAPGRARQRREPARFRASRIRCMALARVLDPARRGHRVQARVLSPRAARARALPALEAADAAAAPVRRAASGDARLLSRSGCADGEIATCCSRRSAARKRA